MHPEILRELNAQRGRDLRERAHRAHLVRTAIQGRRAIRRHAGHLDEVDAFVVPAIPDYVDGSFRAEAPVPAARRAA
jgi:glycerol-3-phosphate dehydrogenase